MNKILARTAALGCVMLAGCSNSESQGSKSTPSKLGFMQKTAQEAQAKGAKSKRPVASPPR